MSQYASPRSSSFAHHLRQRTRQHVLRPGKANRQLQCRLPSCGCGGRFLSGGRWRIVPLLFGATSKPVLHNRIEKVLELRHTAVTCGREAAAANCDRVGSTILIDLNVEIRKEFCMASNDRSADDLPSLRASISPTPGRNPWRPPFNLG